MPQAIVRRPFLFLAVLVVAACGSGGSAASASPSVAASSAAPAASSPSSSPSAAPVSASPSIAASASANASPSAAAAACMPKAKRDLLIDNLTKLGSLTPAQRAEIVTALKAYDFPDATGDTWRDGLVAFITKGDFSGGGFGALEIVSGQVTIKACP